jgi:hypothetical protein
MSSLQLVLLLSKKQMVLCVHYILIVEGLKKKKYRNSSIFAMKAAIVNRSPGNKLYIFVQIRFYDFFFQNRGQKGGSFDA